MMKTKLKLKFKLLSYILVLLGLLGIIIFALVSYMSLNEWDIRCIFVECKPVRIVGGENE